MSKGTVKWFNNDTANQPRTERMYSYISQDLTWRASKLSRKVQQ